MKRVRVSRGVRRAVVGAGAVLIVVGVLGLVFSWGSTSASSPRASSGSSRANAETPAVFLGLYVKALREGHRGFLFDRLDPAVIQRYGAPSCRNATARLLDPTAVLRLVSVTGPVTFNYTTGGRSTSSSISRAAPIRKKCSRSRPSKASMRTSRTIAS